MPPDSRRLDKIRDETIGWLRDIADDEGSCVAYGNHLALVERVVPLGAACFVGFNGIDELFGPVCWDDAITDLAANGTDVQTRELRVCAHG